MPTLPTPPPPKKKADYRIRNQDGTFVNAGTGLDSWFTIEEARAIVKDNPHQTILMWGELETF